MPPMYGFVNTGSWTANARPRSWREGYLKWYPNGRVSLTALTSKTLKSRKITDPEHHWFVDDFPLQRGAITTPPAGTAGLYLVDGVTPYAGGGVVGTALKLHIPIINAAEVRKGHTVQLYDGDHPLNKVVCEVTQVLPAIDAINGELSLRLLEIDNNGIGYVPPLTMVTADRWIVNGTINRENAPVPDDINYQLESYRTDCQIWETPVAMSATAKVTKLRYAPDAYKMLKARKAELHGWEMEKSAFTGVGWVGTELGNPKRAAVGLIPWIEQGATEQVPLITNPNRPNGPSHVFDFQHDAGIAPGTTWLAAGKPWIDKALIQTFANGSSERLCFCGPGAAYGVNVLAEMLGNITLTPNSSVYGLDLKDWQFVGGTLGFKTHPLFAADPQSPLYNAMCIFNPANIGFAYLRDTFTKDVDLGTDGTCEEFITEGSFEWGLACECAMIYGVGLNRP